MDRTWQRREFLELLGGAVTMAALPACSQTDPKPQLSPVAPVEPVDMSALTPVEQVLAQRPFVVSAAARRDIYSNWPVPLFPDAGPSTPLIAGDMSEGQAGLAMDQYLQHEPSGAASQVVDLFNDRSVREKIPSPILRSAFAVLPTTSGQAAIAFILSDKVRKVDWDESGSRFRAEKERAFAQSFTEDDSLVFYFNVRYRGSNINPFLFTSSMMHETLHQDREIVSQLEEAIATAIDVIVTLEQLGKHPEIGRDKTELSRRMMTRALFRFNSGYLARLGLYQTNRNRLVVPDSQRSARSWFENFDGRAYERVDNWSQMETPGNEILVKYMDAIGASSPGKHPNFSKAVLDAIDGASYPTLPPGKLLVIAKHLDLEIPPLPDVTGTSGRRAGEGVLHRPAS